MEKLKNIKKNLKFLKCFMKRYLMSKSNNDPTPRIGPKRKNPNRKTTTSSGVASSGAEEGFIPLAARDSQWVGLEFYNPHFRSPLDEEDDVEEVELQNLAADGIEAIYLLFPGLAKVKANNSLLLKEHESSSTTEITKLLVGQKADFRNMRSSRRLILTDSKLGSVPESLQEEKMQSDTDISTCTTKKSVTDNESAANCADDEGDEPKHVIRHKKLRKKSEIGIMPAASSTSFTPTCNKVKVSTMKIKPSGVSLSRGSTEITQTQPDKKEKQQS